MTAAFPGVRAVATAGTVAGARLQTTDEYIEGFWGRLFPGQIPDAVVLDELEGDRILLEGHELRVIETGHTDTAGSTVLWVPDAGLVVAGDVVYNNTHMYLAETDAASRAEWVAALRRVQDLCADHVVAGHKHPDHDDDPVMSRSRSTTSPTSRRPWPATRIAPTPARSGARRRRSSRRSDVRVRRPDRSLG